MNRNFKVWDPTGEKFIEDERDFFINHKGILCENVERAYTDNVTEEVKIEHWKFKIVDSVGKTDINGIELFSGDKVKIVADTCDHGMDIGDTEIIEWDDRSCGFHPFSEHYDDYCPIDSKNLEKIGSTFENPELLIEEK